jgi:hypothetical protein
MIGTKRRSMAVQPAAMPAPRLPGAFRISRGITDALIEVSWQFAQPRIDDRMRPWKIAAR